MAVHLLGTQLCIVNNNCFIIICYLVLEDTLIVQLEQFLSELVLVPLEVAHVPRPGGHSLPRGGERGKERHRGGSLGAGGGAEASVGGQSGRVERASLFGWGFL